MDDLNDKVTSGTLTASEWNQVPSELQNIIEALGQTLSGADLNQLGKGIAGYIAHGDFYTDSGTANTYILSTTSSKQAPPAYSDGMRVRFVPGNDNTGASTVNVAGLGVKNIKNKTGGTLLSGEITANLEIEITYNSAAGEFWLTSSRESITNVNGAIVVRSSVGDIYVRNAFLSNYLSCNYLSCNYLFAYSDTSDNAQKAIDGINQAGSSVSSTEIIGILGAASPDTSDGMPTMAIGVKGYATRAASGVSGLVGVYGEMYQLNQINSRGVLGECVTGSGNFDFYAGGSAVNYGPFTGSHEGLVKKDFKADIGDIIIDVSVINKANVSNTIMENDISTVKKDKRIIGVLCSDPIPLDIKHPPSALTNKEISLEKNKIIEKLEKDISQIYKKIKNEGNPDKSNEYSIKLNELKAERSAIKICDPIDNFSKIAERFNYIQFNAVGEGQINVCSENGNIEIGDLICTSSIRGKGMMQDDDLIHGYTVARSREKVTWDKNNKNEIKQIACIYLCG